jgi:hypothetical protein
MDMKTLIDIVSSLIKFGFGSYVELMDMKINLLMRFYRWFIKDYEEEKKRQAEYDVALAKVRCPFR